MAGDFRSTKFERYAAERGEAAAKTGIAIRDQEHYWIDY